MDRFRPAQRSQQKTKASPGRQMAGLAVPVAPPNFVGHELLCEHLRQIPARADSLRFAHRSGAEWFCATSDIPVASAMAASCS
jgi:hypothetical protein